MNYILDVDGNPIPCDDSTLWGRWFQTADRIVASDHIGDIHISTVFLAIDHNFAGNGAPVLWETMIFGGPQDGYQQRYSSREEAVIGHAKALELASSGVVQ